MNSWELGVGGRKVRKRAAIPAQKPELVGDSGCKMCWEPDNLGLKPSSTLDTRGTFLPELLSPHLGDADSHLDPEPALRSGWVPL